MLSEQVVLYHSMLPRQTDRLEEGNMYLLCMYVKVGIVGCINEGSEGSGEKPRLRRDTPFTLKSVAALHGDGMATPPHSPQQEISFTTGLRPSTRLPTNVSNF